ncbi:uncharacterized protein At4g14100-like [Panicum virgatum]|uniref:uncharacterized protein At4g14100-like n=1 Tax=Panicum virgatum TaxID=38727 RepID=UPI0019D5070C|nr:uncharacterized protein At4g14100-like [Panicum virgatum]XP_039781705.1 uncharacterized protein At4g14100-like [Panicum virgatum]
MTPLLPVAFLLLLCLSGSPPAAATAGDPTPTPTPWPPQFHAKLVMDFHGNLSVADLWYDWPGGRNLHITRYQLAADAPFYDNEWNNGTSFFYTPSRRACRSAAVGVGILRPDWLSPGAVYLGRQDADGFDCHVWAKADFITYYEDVNTKRPVKWVFYTGRIAYVMSFEVGAVLEDAAWQAPEYCFTKDGGIAETAGEHHDDSFVPRSSL